MSETRFSVDFVRLAKSVSAWRLNAWDRVERPDGTLSRDTQSSPSDSPAADGPAIRFAFKFSRAKGYRTALKYTHLADSHSVAGKGSKAIHTLTFRRDQIDLLAFFVHQYPRYAGPPDSYHQIKQLLEEHGYLAFSWDDSGSRVISHRWSRVPPNPRQQEYARLRTLILQERYADAVDAYYNIFGEQLYDEHADELIYLKRLASIPLKGRELLHFRSESTRTPFIADSLCEYCDCVDEVLQRHNESGLKSPLEIITYHAPTMERLIKRRKKEWHSGVYIQDGVCKMGRTPVTTESFSDTYDACPRGVLFSRYPDQVRHCQIVEVPEDAGYKGLWVTYTPGYYETEVLDKGLHLASIDAWRHKQWRADGVAREPGFMSVEGLDEIEKSDYWADGLRYTGRTHSVGGITFYEVGLIRKDLDAARKLGNPLLELVDEILREAENVLRERHGLPRIGEGWVRETQLYGLVKSVFSDAEQHAVLDWLSPQHLDIYVPSRMLGIEFQGLQHFEPVGFFGGEEGLERTKQRDARKALLCRKHGVTLVYWRYDEAMDTDTLSEKLRQAIGLSIT